MWTCHRGAACSQELSSALAQSYPTDSRVLETGPSRAGVCFPSFQCTPFIFGNTLDLPNKCSYFTWQKFEISYSIVVSRLSRQWAARHMLLVLFLLHSEPPFLHPHWAGGTGWRARTLPCSSLVLSPLRSTNLALAMAQPWWAELGLSLQPGQCHSDLPCAPGSCCCHPGSWPGSSAG